MDQQGNAEQGSTRLVSRRTVALGAAWTAPVVLFAVASPSASASTLPETRSANLATATGEKGEAVGTNRKVTFILSFAAVVGTNSVSITSIEGGEPWAVLPTDSATVDAAHTSVPFVLTRPDNNASLAVVVHYTVNGVAYRAEVTVKNKAK